MRLSPDQSHAIVKATRAVAGEQAQVRLFGSRLDDSARGGDIDIVVELPQPVQRPSLPAAQVTASIQRALGDRKVDVLIIDPTTELQPTARLCRVTRERDCGASSKPRSVEPGVRAWGPGSGARGRGPGSGLVF